MPKGRLIKSVALYCAAIRQSSKNCLPMRLRLFFFMILFLSSIMLGVLLILFSTGIFNIGLSEHRTVFEGELAHIAEDIYKSIGKLSVHTVDLSKELSANIERNLKEHGGSITAIQEHPDLLEHLMGEELVRLTGALEKSNASGVFLLLDATVNPMLAGADNSRSCLYLKNMEPNIVNGMAANLRFAIGPMTLARKHGIHILPQWEMELDIGEMSFFTKVMNGAREEKRHLSRLYRWSEATVLPGGSERIMVCAVPLIASDGTVFGVCGFEISEMLFKLSYAPKPEKYHHMFCLLSPITDNTLQLSGALSAGSYMATTTTIEHTELAISSDSGGFYNYQQPGMEGYAGLHQLISLYPADSKYSDEHWVVALMMPSQALNTLISSTSYTLIIGLLALILINIALAFFISRKYIQPVVAALEHLKKPNPTADTKITEINDLIEFLSAQDELHPPREQKSPQPQERSALFLGFVKNIQKLSAAEKLVFDLYVKGYTAKEIAEILCLSINTIKTHNRRIYMKLNVSSRKELMVYIQMMEEAGYTIEQ